MMDDDIALKLMRQVYIHEMKKPPHVQYRDRAMFFTLEHPLQVSSFTILGNMEA